MDLIDFAPFSFTLPPEAAGKNRQPPLLSMAKMSLPCQNQIYPELFRPFKNFFVLDGATRLHHPLQSGFRDQLDGIGKRKKSIAGENRGLAGTATSNVMM